MSNIRELSQLASLINVVDENKNIGIVTVYPNAKVGIGTIVPNAKVDVVGDAFVSGIISATSFYGDGSNLTNIISSGGGGSIGIGATFPETPENGDLFFHIDYGRTFIYYDEVILGVGSSTFWIDASPFNQSVTGGDTLDVVTSRSGITTNNISVGILSATDGNFTGVVTATELDSISDERLKENIITVEDSIQKVNSLRGVKFDWKKTKESSYGVIAQELEKVLPELVADGETKSVNYNGIIAVLIEAVKELSSRLDKLEGF